MNIGTDSSIIKRDTKDNSRAGIQSYAKIMKSVIMGTIVSLLASVVFMAVFAMIINQAFGDPDSVLQVFIIIASSIGAIIGGFYASRSNGSKGLLCGLLTGSSVSIILFTVMIFTIGGKSENANVVFRLVNILCQIIFGCIGGIFAVNSHKSRKTTYQSISRKK